ncbi:MAG: hypothetical protein VKO19_01280 [Cyanobacteriota bacterium]|nr:hypothetical protein [Cyanobacteriota bacterium]
MEVSELMEDLRERLRPFRTRLFPKQVLFEITDDLLLVQPVVNGQPGKNLINVPLPEFTIKQGKPIQVEALGDLIGDVLLRDGLMEACVMASLPQEAVEWRVIHWASSKVPENGLEALRRENPQLGLPYSLEEAAMDLRPLEGEPGKQLMASARREVVEGWIQVFHQAGTTLDRLACPQACRLAALQGQLEEIRAGSLVVLLSSKAGGDQLMAIRDGAPLFEWPLPNQGSALVEEVRRCVAFLRREFGRGGELRVLLDGELEVRGELEATLGVGAQQLDCSPYGSLVLQGLAIPERVG